MDYDYFFIRGVLRLEGSAFFGWIKSPFEVQKWNWEVTWSAWHRLWFLFSITITITTSKIISTHQYPRFESIYLGGSLKASDFLSQIVFIFSKWFEEKEREREREQFCKLGRWDDLRFLHRGIFGGVHSPASSCGCAQRNPRFMNTAQTLQAGAATNQGSGRWVMNSNF